MLVTKAVSESFGKGGIADQMIKFNGYPFLEKEDPEGNDQAFLQPSGCSSSYSLSSGFGLLIGLLIGLCVV